MHSKKGTTFKAGKKTMLLLSLAGILTGTAIIITVLIGYLSLLNSGFYYGNVKIGGSVLSHQIDSDIYIIVVSAFLVGSSTFLLLRILRKKRGK